MPTFILTRFDCSEPPGLIRRLRGCRCSLTGMRKTALCSVTAPDGHAAALLLGGSRGQLSLNTLHPQILENVRYYGFTPGAQTRHRVALAYSLLSGDDSLGAEIRRANEETADSTVDRPSLPTVIPQPRRSYLAAHRWGEAVMWDRLTAALTLPQDADLRPSGGWLALGEVRDITQDLLHHIKEPSATSAD